MKRFLQTLVCDLLASSSRRRTAARRGTMVFCFHGVNDRFDPDWYRSSHLERAVFERIVDELAEVFDFVSLDGALNGAPAGDRPTAVLSFDDGYFDHLTHVAPVLRARGIPAVFYVPAIALGGEAPLWFDLVRMVLAWHPLETLPPGTRVRFTDAPRKTLFAEHRLPKSTDAVAILRRSPPERVEAFCNGIGDLDLGTWLEPDAASHLRTLDLAGLRELAADPLFTIGSHAVHHVDLAGQDEDVQRSELADSKRALEEALGAPVDHFAYPSGSYDARTPGLAKEAGYRSAATTDRAWMTERSDPFRLPRLIVGIGKASYCFYKAARLP